MDKLIENKNIKKIETKFAKDEDGKNKIVGLTVGNKYYDFLDKEKYPSFEELDEIISSELGLPSFLTAIDILYDMVISIPGSVANGIREDTFNRIISMIVFQKTKRYS